MACIPKLTDQRRFEKMIANDQNTRRIRVIIVDDSIRYRSLLSELLKNHPFIEVIGEAVNGIEALEIIWNSKPDVILMDFEMPIMDGMTALQHLMIHLPTPTIMFSHLTKEGTARCFDALKNGAVDFFCKDNLPTKRSDTLLMQELTERVVCASKVIVNALEPVFPPNPKKTKNKLIKTLVFCEECGAKTELVIRENEDQGGVLCSNCNEFISLMQRNKYRRANYLSVILGGEGAYINLLKLIPGLPQDINGALLLLVDGTVDHVNAFASYLNSISTINVVRIRDGVSIQGGNCYVGSVSESIVMKPFTADYTFHFEKKIGNTVSGVDRTIVSITRVFRNRSAVVFLSGNEVMGEAGVKELLSNGGSLGVLEPGRCLFKEMGDQIISAYNPPVIASEEQLAEKLHRLHLRFRDTVVTA